MINIALHFDASQTFFELQKRRGKKALHLLCGGCVLLDFILPVVVSAGLTGDSCPFLEETKCHGKKSKNQTPKPPDSDP